jgi:hypothetical protein
MPDTLSTLAAALVSCPHPLAARVFPALADDADAQAAAWCAECGALRAQDPTPSWQWARFPSRLTKAHFDDVALLLHSIRQLNALAQTHDAGLPAHAPFRRLRASLAELSRLPLVRSLDRLEEAIERLPRTAPLVAL